MYCKRPFNEVYILGRRLNRKINIFLRDVLTLNLDDLKYYNPDGAVLKEPKLISNDPLWSGHHGFSLPSANFHNLGLISAGGTSS